MSFTQTDIKESTMINEGTFSEIDNAIQEYIMHVNMSIYVGLNVKMY